MRKCLVGCLLLAPCLVWWLLSAGPIPSPPPLVVGINLDGNDDWMTAAVWVNVKNLCRRWGDADKPWVDAPSLKLTPDGYPLQDAGTLSYLKSYPNGTYLLHYEGTGTATFGGIATLEAPPVKKGIVTTAKVRIDHSKGDLMTLTLRGIDPTDPVHALRLLAPGYPLDTKQRFTKEFLRRVQPFKVVRFMDWTHTNDHPIQHWNERTQPNSFQRTGARGVAWEDVIALANAVQADVWINIPDQASDDYVRELARLVHAQLHAKAVIHLEYSNEVWNGQFAQSKRVFQAAQRNRELTATDPNEKQAQQVAFKLKTASDIFRDEFGPQAERLSPVLAGQAVNRWWIEKGLAFIAAKYGPPQQYFKEIAIAFYADSEDFAKVDRPGLTLDALFAELDRIADKEMPAWVRTHKQLADKVGLALSAYEGGQSLVAWNAQVKAEVNVELKQKAQNDPRMGVFLAKLLRAWNREGGGLFMHFTHISPPGKFGCWGLLDSMDHKGSVKWDAVLEFVVPPGDATLDGHVDFADFTLLKSHFLRKGAWWEEGDFNHDGLVDAADFRILKKHLGPLTPEQVKVIEEFEVGLPLERK